MTEETNDLTAREILDFLLTLPLLWAFMFIGVALIVIGKILDLVRGGEN
jgi:hypothetical protein